MGKMKLLFTTEVNLDEDRQMRLEYNLTENLSFDSGEPYYGIRIIKYIGDNLEMEEVKGISFSKERVEAITKTLHQNVVTPITLVEIVDDLITLEAV